MEHREDPPDSVVEEIASILATGYLRLRNARTLAGSAEESVEGLDSAWDTSPHRAGS